MYTCGSKPCDRAGPFQRTHRLPLLNFFARGFIQKTRQVGVAELLALDHVAVPHAVEVGVLAEPRHPLAVAALVIAVTDVQRLVQVSDEVHQEFQAFGFLGGRKRVGFQGGGDFPRFSR